MIDFPRYLSAKKTVDDRALNRVVWSQLIAVLPDGVPGKPLRILEIGCGIGTMVERLLEWELAEQVSYLGIDSQAVNIQVAKARLPTWGQQHGYDVRVDASGILLSKGNLSWQVQFQEADFKNYGSKEVVQGAFDLQIAQAFLDLVDVPKTLPILAGLLSQDGLFYYTLNFDGVTIFEPVADQAFESQLMACYHRSMDERLVNGLPSGDSCTGRHLFGYLRDCGAHILGAGASDWVVFPGTQGYPADEACFLRCILDFFETTLKEYPELDQDALESWLASRRSQVEAGELVYIAHQIDILGTFSGLKFI